MRKRIPWPFFRDWAITFAALVGAVSGFFAVVPGVSITVFRSIVILGLCCAISAAVTRQRTLSRQLPLEDLQDSETSIHCRVECPAGRRLLKQANDLAAHAFGSIEGIPFDRYDALLLKNPTILACLVNANGDLVGYFDVLPLRSEFMDRFIRGDLTELDIRHEDVLSPQHARRCKRLYLAGVAVRDPNTFSARRYARHLIWALSAYLKHFYGVPSERQLFTLGGTREGRQLLQRFHFHMIQSGSLRRDGQDLFVITLNDPRTVENVDADVGSWSQACHLSWQEQPQSAQRRSIG